MQLYHPEMRVNSSKFDMNDLTFNFIPGCVDNKGLGSYTSLMYPHPGTAAFFSQVMPFNYRDWETDRKSTRLNSSHEIPSRMPSSA